VGFDVTGAVHAREGKQRSLTAIFLLGYELIT
jgi:hypothetical protein